MEVEYVPFTNNRGENDLRKTKVQQKIFGCFRSMQALTLLFEDKSSDFMKKDEA